MKRQWLTVAMMINLILSGCIGETISDIDKDGIKDREDTDREGDGWENLIEIDCNSNPNNFEDFPSDLDNDTICDTLDEDIDGDKLPNNWELDRGFDPLDSNDTMICHGASEYCLRNYDDFTFPETHNSFAASEDGVVLGTNHYTGLQSQWDGGIRAFMVDAHPIIKVLSRLAEKSSFPIFHSMMGTLENKDKWFKTMEDAGVAMFENSEDMAESAGILAQYLPLKRNLEENI